MKPVVAKWRKSEQRDQTKQLQQMTNSCNDSGTGSDGMSGNQWLAKNQFFCGFQPVDDARSSSEPFSVPVCVGVYCVSARLPAMLLRDLQRRSLIEIQQNVSRTQMPSADDDATWQLPLSDNIHAKQLQDGCTYICQTA